MNLPGPRGLPAMFGFCLIVGMSFSVISRTDANWDLQNYHLYAPYAALHGRLGMDWFAAGFQGYLNPTEDIPYYLAKMVLFPGHPVFVAALAGLPFGFLIFITLKIARVVMPDNGWAAFLATILGLTGATTLSEVGTTYDDILIADFVLTAVYLLLDNNGARIRALAVSGFLVGCAVGLKFTAVIYVPGFVVLAVWKTPRFIWRDIAIAGFFAGLGFLAVWGWWGWQLWEHFGNPLFPMLGNLFPKSAVQDISFHDARFSPRTILQWIVYPFFWLQGKSFVVSEEPLRDPRFALAYVALGMRVIAETLKKARPNRGVTLALSVFFIVTYILWLIGFSILRYALALEAISGVIVWSVLSELYPRRAGFIALCVLTSFVLVFTKPMGWGRIGYGKSMVMAPIPSVPAHSVVLMAGAPIGFLVPYLNTQSEEFRSLDFIHEGTAEFELTKQALANGSGAELLTNSGAAKIRSLYPMLAALGLTYSDSDCVSINSPVQNAIKLCRLSPLD